MRDVVVQVGRGTLHSRVIIGVDIDGAAFLARTIGKLPGNKVVSMYRFWPKANDVGTDASKSAAAAKDVRTQEFTQLWYHPSHVLNRDSARLAALNPHMPCTPPPGGVEAEHK